jgi:hypothetical protein
MHVHASVVFEHPFQLCKSWFAFLSVSWDVTQVGDQLAFLPDQLWLISLLVLSISSAILRASRGRPSACRTRDSDVAETRAFRVRLEAPSWQISRIRTAIAADNPALKVR